jgi:hypothetical protein
LSRDNAAELLPLITGYAQAGRYNQAVQVSLQAGRLSDKLSLAICDRWYQLGSQLQDNPGFQAALAQVNQKFQCPSEPTP